jgi:hypothetical protein
MATKTQIIDRMQALQREIEQAVSTIPEEAWARGVYEGGWNAREILAHMASTSGTAGFLLGMARMSSAPTLGGSYDENAFNAQQVASRAKNSTSELLDEIRRNIQLGVDSVQSAPDDLISKHFRAPWGVEGEVGDVIIESLEGHLGMHLTDLKSTVL